VLNHFEHYMHPTCLTAVCLQVRYSKLCHHSAITNAAAHRDYLNVEASYAHMIMYVVSIHSAVLEGTAACEEVLAAADSLLSQGMQLNLHDFAYIYIYMYTY
jgi:hypothetical protein